VWFAWLVAPEIAEELDGVGLAPAERYFAGRAAPLGAASLPLVVSTFFNFSPAAVGQAIPSAWEKARPEAVLAAHLRGTDRALQRALADVDTAVVAELAELMRRAAEAACEHVEGRPLFASYAALPWPDDPHLVVWHAHYLLREFRGDGHIAVLVAEGLTGIEALLVQVAMLPAMTGFVRATRAWSDDEWAAAIESLRASGWLTGDEQPTPTEDGRARRRAIEARTDELDLPGYGALGADGCRRVIELAAPVGTALEAAGLTLAGLRPR
jgi:hypothetical protein